MESHQIPWFQTAKQYGLEFFVETHWWNPKCLNPILGQIPMGDLPFKPFAKGSIRIQPAAQMSTFSCDDLTTEIAIVGIGYLRCQVWMGKIIVQQHISLGCLDDLDRSWRRRSKCGFPFRTYFMVMFKQFRAPLSPVAQCGAGLVGSSPVKLLLTNRNPSSCRYTNSSLFKMAIESSLI